MKFNCPNCQYLLKVPDNAAGRTGTCPKCHNKVRVPDNAGATGRAAPGPRADRPARCTHGVSLPTSPSLPAKKGGFGQFAKMGCFFVALMFIVLTLIGALAGRQNRDRESPGQSSASRSNDLENLLVGYGDWETPMELEDPEYQEDGYFAIAKLSSRGTSLGGDLVMFEDGRIFNRKTFKVKCPK